MKKNMARSFPFGSAGLAVGGQPKHQANELRQNEEGEDTSQPRKYIRLQRSLMTRNLFLIFVQSSPGKLFPAGLKSDLVAQAQLFLSVFQGEHGTRATLPQSLHLIRLLLEGLAGLQQSFQLVLDKHTTEVWNFKLTSQSSRVDEAVQTITFGRFGMNLVSPKDL